MKREALFMRAQADSVLKGNRLRLEMAPSPEAAVHPKKQLLRGEGENHVLSRLKHLKVERHAARYALESRARNSCSREVPFVDDDTVPDRAKIVVRIGMIGLPRVDKVR
jgi:hypothetical protein